MFFSQYKTLRLTSIRETRSKIKVLSKSTVCSNFTTHFSHFNYAFFTQKCFNPEMHKIWPVIFLLSFLPCDSTLTSNFNWRSSHQSLHSSRWHPYLSHTCKNCFLKKVHHHRVTPPPPRPKIWWLEFYRTPKRSKFIYNRLLAASYLLELNYTTTQIQCLTNVAQLGADSSTPRFKSDPRFEYGLDTDRLAA